MEAVVQNIVSNEVVQKLAELGLIIVQKELYEKFEKDATDFGVALVEIRDLINNLSK